jgi:type IV secretion system protein VirB4
MYTRAARLFVQGDPVGVAWPQIVATFTAALTMLVDRLGAHLRLERLTSDALLSHLHACLTGLSHRVLAPPHGTSLDAVLATHELVTGFAPTVGARRPERVIRVVAIDGYPPRAALGQLDFLMHLPFTCRWSNRYIALSAHTAERLIKRHQRQWFMARKGVGSFVREVTSSEARSDRRQRQEEEFFHDRDATAMARDAAEALAEQASGAVRYGLVTQVVIVADADAATADAHAAAVRTALRDHGFAARIETVNAADALFGSLPGHGDANLRRPLLHTRNVAAVWPITATWSGLAQNPSPYFPPASPPLMQVATDGATPFRFNLHIGDVGHALVVGATGAGKSTFVGLTLAQWQRYAGARTYVFDVGYSHWLLCRAAGGQHYDLCAGRPDTVAFQPLADVDDPTERAWAASWLESTVRYQGVIITPAQRLQIGHALTLVAAQARAYRTLTEFTVQVQDRAIADALAPYCVAGLYGRLLDANTDPVGRARYQVFELRRLLELGEAIAGPVFEYLAHRVARDLDGSPTLTVVEEFHAFLHSTFPEVLQGWFLTQRKQNGAVLLVTHAIAQLDDLAARTIILDSCPTRILLPNPDATSASNAPRYRDLGLNDREIARLATATPKRDYYVTSPLGSRLVTLDLGPVAHAFLGTPSGQILDTVRGEVDALAQREGPAWPRAWLAHLGVTPPTDTDYALEGPVPPPAGAEARSGLAPDLAVDDVGGAFPSRPGRDHAPSPLTPEGVSDVGPSRVDPSRF